MTPLLAGSPDAEAVVLDVAELNGCTGELLPGQPGPATAAVRVRKSPIRVQSAPPVRAEAMSSVRACARCGGRVEGAAEHPGCLGPRWEVWCRRAS